MKICDYCENLVTETINNMCPECRRQYLLIRELVVSSPKISVFEVSKRTGINVRKIQSFSQKGWFVMGEGSMEALD